MSSLIMPPNLSNAGLNSEPSPQKSSVPYQYSQFRRRVCLPTHRSRGWQILRGVVRTMTWEEDGTVVFLGFWQAGDVVGQLASVDQPLQIECLTPVEAVSIAVQDLDPKEWLLRSAQQTETLVRLLHESSIEKRLLRFLHWTAQQFGQETAEGWLINFHLTHQDIAEAISATRVTITRLLGKLVQDQQIAWQPKRYILLRRR